MNEEEIKKFIDDYIDMGLFKDPVTARPYLIDGFKLGLAYKKCTERYILCAASHYDDGKVYVHQPKNIKSGFVVAGRRHHNCIATATQLCENSKNLSSIQGFLTDDDYFVNRQEAFKIAVEASQCEDAKEKTLLSEDLY
jgi:hypothetical protein